MNVALVPFPHGDLSARIEPLGRRVDLFVEQGFGRGIGLFLAQPQSDQREGQGDGRPQNGGKRGDLDQLEAEIPDIAVGVGIGDNVGQYIEDHTEQPGSQNRCNADPEGGTDKERYKMETRHTQPGAQTVLAIVCSRLSGSKHMNGDGKREQCRENQ